MFSDSQAAKCPLPVSTRLRLSELSWGRMGIHIRGLKKINLNKLSKFSMIAPKLTPMKRNKFLISVRLMADQ